MPGDTPTLADVERSIDAIFAPLREQIARVDAELAVIDNRKAELKEVRAKLKRILVANEPRAKLGARKDGRTAHPTGVAQEKLDAVLALADEYEGEFTTADLRADFDIVKRTGLSSNQVLSKALSILHERGALRLVRSGTPESPRMKVWEVTKRA